MGRDNTVIGIRPFSRPRATTLADPQYRRTQNAHPSIGPPNNTWRQVRTELIYQASKLALVSEHVKPEKAQRQEQPGPSHLIIRFHLGSSRLPDHVREMFGSRPPSNVDNLGLLWMVEATFHCLKPVLETGPSTTSATTPFAGMFCSFLAVVVVALDARAAWLSKAPVALGVIRKGRDL